jgi:hypothetical protein
MTVKGIKLPYYVKIILIIILDIWLLWSHHGVLYTQQGKLEILNPFDFRICTFGEQWPSSVCRKYSHKHEAAFANTQIFTHYIPFIKDNYKDIVLCSSVCGFGRLGVWSSILVSNVIYLTTNKFRKGKKQLKTIQIIGWILLGMNMGLSLILNWTLFIRSIPAYVILILLQLDLYADEPNATPSTSTKQLV